MTVPLTENLEPPARRVWVRFVVFGIAVVLVVTALGFRLFQLQVVEAGYYRSLAVRPRTATTSIRVSRGLMYDRDGRQLVENVPLWVVKVIPADLPFNRRDYVVNRLAALLRMSKVRIYQKIDRLTGSRFDPVKLATDIPARTARIIAEEQLQLPGVYVEVESRRHYLYGKLVSHILGWTGPVTAGDLEHLADDGYLLDDVIGRGGVEQTFERELRGKYGVQEVERDAQGRVVRVLQTLQEPRAGYSLELTIDLDIQRTAEQALRWAMVTVPLQRGVFIVMNPQTGEILAMVSLPAYDNNRFADGVTKREWRKLLNNPAKPLMNFAINEHFPPGSTYKLVTGSGALADGRIGPGTVLATAPYLTIGNYKYWDWNEAGFGPVNIYGGFAHSSDTFFYQVARMLGIDRLAYWAHQFGFGYPTGVDLPGEVSGLIPTNAWKKRVFNQPIYPGEVYHAGIGQGYNLVTPLQLINAYNVLANGGTLYRPQIVRRILGPQGKVIKPFKPDPIRRVPISGSVLRTMRIAARGVPVERHTYNLVDVPVVMAVKSGTAEFGLRDYLGRLPFHSWSVGFTPRNWHKTSSDPGGFGAVARTDAQLSFLAFAFDSRTEGNAATEIVKYFLQLYYNVDGDYRQTWLLRRTNFYGQ
jgi:penicillin-binding protein 2